MNVENLSDCKFGRNYHIKLPEDLWCLDNGTELTCSEGGNLVAAKDGDYVCGVVEHIFGNHYVRLVMCYRKYNHNDAQTDDKPDWFICEVCECDMFHILEYESYYHCSCAHCGMVKTIMKGVE